MKKYYNYFSNVFFMIKRVYKLDKGAIWIKLLLCITEILQLFIPLLFVRWILNGIEIGRDIKYILSVTVFFVSATVICKLIQELFMRMDERNSDTILRLVRRDIARLVIKMSYCEIEKPETKDFIQMVQEFVDIQLLFNLIFGLFRQVLTLIGLVAIVLTLHPVYVALVVLVIVFRVFSNNSIRKLWDKWRYPINAAQRKGSYMLYLMNDIGYGKEIRINGLQEWFTDKTSDAMKNYLKQMSEYNNAIQRRNAFVEGANIFQVCVLYTMLAFRVVVKGMYIGDFTMYLSGIQSLSNCLSDIVDSVSNLLKEGQFLEKYRNTIERYDKSVIYNGDAFVKKDGEITIVFENVSFHYPESTEWVLKDINFEMKTNQSLSIVGLNGAGKTTIVKLLCRFYKPVRGRILLNGIDINEIPDEEYKKILGVVFQDYQLFAFSILENVAIVPSYDEKKSFDALERVGLGKKVKELERGIHTYMSKELDEFGMEFSGGEGQRVELARVLYKEAPVVILDEPTASLDSMKEYELYKTMYQLVQNKCSIFISHRLPSTKFTDYTMVLKDGRIVEYGTFDELMQNTDGYFYKMYELQRQQYVE